MHPSVGIVVTQPLRIFPAEGNNVGPDVAGVVVHFLLYLGQDNGDTFICEQTIAAGTLINVLEIHIPLWSVTMQFHDTADERICVATGGVCKIVLVFVAIRTLWMLFEQCFDLLLLFGCGRQMAGGIFRHLHTFTGGDVL